MLSKPESQILKKRVQALRKMLADDFGIMNDAELLQAISEMEKVDISIMVSPLREPCNKINL